MDRRPNGPESCERPTPTNSVNPVKQLTATIACFLASVALAQEPSDKPTDQQRWTDRIFQWVGDMSDDRDQLIKRRYAVLMDGVMIHPNTPLASDGGGQLKVEVIEVPYERPFQRIYARHGTDFEYRAFNLIFSRPGPDQQQHHWVEFLRAGEITRGRSLLVNEIDRQAPTYVDRPADITVGNWHTKEFSSTKGFTPYDSFVIPFSFLLHGYHPQSVEKVLLKQMQFRTVIPQVGGMYVSEWVRKQNGGELLLRITHDSSKEWMPTEVSLKSGKGWPKNMKVDQHMRLLQWRQIDRFWLPHMVEHSENFDGRDEHISQVLKLQWTVGAKAPDTAFDPKTEDLRQPILDHFGTEFMRIEDGQVMPPPYYQPPADLLEVFQDDQSK